jgi:hypothetical protein
MASTEYIHTYMYVMYMYRHPWQLQKLLPKPLRTKTAQTEKRRTRDR